MKSEMWIAFADAHYPRYDIPTWRAFISFAAQNPIRGVVDLGDTCDNSCISRHTEGKPGLRGKSEYVMDTEGFFKDMVEPLEAALKESRKKFNLKAARKVRILGNHCDWEREYYEQHPELDGALDRNGRLVELGWEIVPFASIFKYGKLNYAHGETIKGKYHANNAVEIFCRNVLYAHYHTLQTMTKILPTDQTQKWIATCSPIIGHTNPKWMENKPNAWVNGWNIIEYHGEGNFNLYPVITTKGVASYAGKIYKG